MDKPHIRRLFSNWWCFSSRAEAQRAVAGDPHVKGWYGASADHAYRRWCMFNRMKP